MFQLLISIAREYQLTSKLLRGDDEERQQMPASLNFESSECP